MNEKTTILFNALYIATFSLTVGIVSMEVMVVHKCVIQGTTFAPTFFVVQYMVRCPVITMEWSKEQHILRAITAVNRAQQLFGCKIVALFMFTISRDILCFVIAVLVALIATSAQLELQNQKPHHYSVQFHLHQTWYVYFNCTTLKFYSRIPNNWRKSL